VYEDKFVITGSDDGAVRMWSVDRREQTLQFLVINQVCIIYHIILYHFYYILCRLLIFTVLFYIL